MSAHEKLDWIERKLGIWSHAVECPLVIHFERRVALYRSVYGLMVISPNDQHDIDSMYETLGGPK